jgi:prepilin peptidase CpaA
MYFHLTAFQIVAIVIAVFAAACDLRTRRIPNWLTFGAAVLAVVAHTWAAGLSGFASAIAGWSVGVLLFLPIFILRGMGAGDVKLLAALGAWIGPILAIWVGLYSAIAAGVIGVVVGLLGGYLGTAFRNIWLLLMEWRLRGPRASETLNLAAHRGPRLAYAVPMLTGLMVALWLH